MLHKGSIGNLLAGAHSAPGATWNKGFMALRFIRGRNGSLTQRSDLNRAQLTNDPSAWTRGRRQILGHATWPQFKDPLIGANSAPSLLLIFIYWRRKLKQVYGAQGWICFLTQKKLDVSDCEAFLKKKRMVPSENFNLD